MPPALDIYVLTEQRDLPAINWFLDSFADCAAGEDRGDEVLMMAALPDAGNATTEEFTEELALTLTHSIQRGLDYPRRAFSVYLKSSDTSIDCAYIAFTADDQLVIGVSVDDTDELPEKERRAKELLSQLAKSLDAHIGIIMVEQPPPWSEQEFRDKEGQPLTVYFWRHPTEGYNWPHI